MASIEKNLNTSVPANVVGIQRAGIKPWSPSNMDDSTHPGTTPGVAKPASGLKPITDRLGVVTDQQCIQTRPGATGQICTDATQQLATTSSHPNNGPGSLKDPAAVPDNALGGAVNTRLDVNGPANTGQPADVATYGPADPSSKQGYSILN